MFGCTYQCLIVDIPLLGVCDDSPLQQLRLVVRPVLLYVTLPVRHMHTNLEINLIGFFIAHNLHILQIANVVAVQVPTGLVKFICVLRLLSGVHSCYFLFYIYLVNISCIT